jgi:hypothetical protein
MTSPEAREVSVIKQLLFKTANISSAHKQIFIGIVVYEVSVRMCNGKILQVSFVNLAKVSVLKLAHHIINQI